MYKAGSNVHMNESEVSSSLENDQCFAIGIYISNFLMEWFINFKDEPGSFESSTLLFQINCSYGFCTEIANIFVERSHRLNTIGII